MKFKKTLLSLALVSATLTPLSVVSCGKSKTKPIPKYVVYSSRLRQMKELAKAELSSGVKAFENIDGVDKTKLENHIVKANELIKTENINQSKYLEILNEYQAFLVDYLTIKVKHAKETAEYKKASGETKEKMDKFLEDANKFLWGLKFVEYFTHSENNDGNKNQLKWIKKIEGYFQTTHTEFYVVLTEN